MEKSKEKGIIELRAMTEPEFADFKALIIEDYAQRISRSYEAPMDKAMAASAGQINGLLKEGLSTPDHFLYNIVPADSPAGRAIGWLWFSDDEQKARCTLCYIYIMEEYRGKGWGRKTLDMLETMMKAKGINKIELHVFAGNSVARKLYEKLGYRVTGLNMQKKL